MKLFSSLTASVSIAAFKKLIASSLFSSATTFAIEKSVLNISSFFLANSFFMFIFALNKKLIENDLDCTGRHNGE